MLKNLVGDEDVGYHLEIGPTAKGIGFKKVKNHSQHYLHMENAMRELPKHYSSREEVMREAEKYNKDEVETEENRENYTPTNKESEPFYSDEDRKREISAKYKNIKDPIDKKVEQIRDLKTLIDNTGEEVNKINWNNIRIEDNEIICGEDWKLYDLTADNPTQGIRSGINSVPEDVRRKVFDITEEYFKEKKYIFNNE